MGTESGVSKKLPVFTGKLSGLKIDGVQQKGVTYSDWRYKLKSKALAAGGGIWEYLSRATRDRPTGDHKAKYEAMLDMMVDSLQDDALTTAKALADDRQTPRNILHDLDEKFLSQSMSSRMFAVTKLVGDAQGDETVDAFVAEKRRILREDLQGKVDPEELLLGSIIRGLNTDYEDLVGTMLSTDYQDTIDIDDILSKLRDKEKRLGDRKELDVKASVAMRTSQNSNEDLLKDISTMIDKKVQAAHYVNNYQGGGKNWPKKPWGKDRKGKGKIKGNGKKGGSKKGGGKKGHVGKTGKGERKCYNCSGYGHEAATCPSPKKQD